MASLARASQQAAGAVLSVAKQPACTRGMANFLQRKAMAAVMTSFEQSVGPSGSRLIVRAGTPEVRSLAFPSRRMAEARAGCTHANSAPVRLPSQDRPILDIPHPMSMADLSIEPVKPCVASLLFGLGWRRWLRITTWAPPPHVAGDRTLTPAPHRIAALRLDAFPDLDQADPFALMGAEVRSMSDTIKDLLGVDHPVLGSVAKYFFDHDGGKKVRPTMVMLMAHALNAHAQAEASGTVPPTPASHAPSVDAPVTPLAPSSTPTQADWELVEASQRRLAEITEMIHTASLLHDDVIDLADTRRGVSSVNSVFGNKLAILAGDFLLARASVCLARLRSVPVVELMSTVIEHLVKGEVMQMKATLRNATAAGDAFDTYMRKTFYKTGSLMANSCRSAALLGGLPEAQQEWAYGYGKHLGLSFQLVDDVLDFTGTEESLGKPAGNDLSQGLVTAPVLFASEQHPAVLDMMQRQFQGPGDVQAAVQAVRAAGSLDRTHQFALAHAQLALDAIEGLAPSPARTALAALVVRVVDRSR